MVEQFSSSKGNPVENPNLNLEKINVGSPAVKVLLEIVKSNPEIEKMTYVKYIPDEPESYGDESFEIPDIYELLPLQLSEEKLHSLDYDIQCTSRKDPSYLMPVTKIFGLTSKVILKDGSEDHIPMMDFYCYHFEKKEEILPEIEKYMKPFHGFILDSGNAYHFWGTQLMNKKEWQNFLDFCYGQKHTDRNWIDFSKLQDFCILRVFEYIDPDEDECSKAEPKVVKILR